MEAGIRELYVVLQPGGRGATSQESSRISRPARWETGRVRKRGLAALVDLVWVMSWIEIEMRARLGWHDCAIHLSGIGIGLYEICAEFVVCGIPFGLWYWLEMFLGEVLVL